MSSFASCSYQRKNNCGTNSESCKQESNSRKKKSSKESESKKKEHSQKKKASNLSHHKEKNASVDKRQLEFEKEFAKNKAKEFKDANSKSKAQSNRFERSEKAKNVNRNHHDNQRNLKNQEYCLIEEKKYIKKRFLKDDTAEECENLEKNVLCDFEEAKDERCRSESHRKFADERESSFCENAKSLRSECANRTSCAADQRSYSACSDKAYENRCEQSESDCSEKKSRKSSHKSRKDKKRC